MLRVIFIISTVCLMFTAVFWGIYRLAFAPQTDTLVQVSQKSSHLQKDRSIAEELVEAPAKISPLADVYATAPFVDSVKREVLFFTADGRRITVPYEGGAVAVVGPDPLPDFVDAVWSTDGTKAITEHKEDGQKRFYVRDFVTGDVFRLPDGVEKAVWGHSGARVLYKQFQADQNSRRIFLSDIDGKNPRKLFDNVGRFVAMAPIPMSLKVAQWETPWAGQPSALWTASTTGALDPTKIFDKGTAADFLFAANGRRVLVSHIPHGSDRPVLGVMRDDGSEYVSLGVPTLASKCVWDDEGIDVYCGILGGFSSDTVFPNDYMTKKFFSADTFWRIDTTTGKKQRIVPAEELKDAITYDATQLRLSPTEGEIFFINRTDNKLYIIDL